MNQAEILEKIGWKNYNINKISMSASAAEAEQENHLQSNTLIKTILNFCEFFCGIDEKIYAKLKNNDHYENWDLESDFFKSWVIKRIYEQKEKPPTQSAVADAINTIRGLISYNNSIPKKEISLRVGGDYKELFIDLCNDSWEAIKINAEGWGVVSCPRTPFRRYKAMRPLPEPQRGGNIELLRKYVSCEGDDFVLFVFWLIGAFSPVSPYPLMILQGTQGAGKSTHSKIARSLVDPNVGVIRSTPKNEQDLMISANSSWVMAYDNLSGIPTWLSDSLCRLSTGGGLSTRKLYSNDEETIFTATRPIILNGIDDIATRGDLADRSLIIHLQSISEQKRKSEKEYWEEFKNDHALIFGAICDILSSCIRNLPNVYLDKLPRMADFAKWATAGEQQAGFESGAFMNAYNRNRSEAIEITLQNDIFISSLIKFMLERSEWIGSPEKLLNQELGSYATEMDRRSKSFPKINTLKNKLQRYKPQLEEVGIIFQHSKKRSGVEYIFRNKEFKIPSQPSQPSQA
jgi:hypothetical protein